MSAGALDFGAPFIKVVVMARLLGLDEPGPASAAAANCGAFEQVADIAISRFVFSSPRVKGP